MCKEIVTEVIKVMKVLEVMEAMMELTYESAQGMTVTLGTSPSDEDVFFLSAADGLYGLRSESYMMEPAEQAGSVWISSRVTRRIITLEGWISRDVPINRRRLTVCLSPLELGWLTLRRDESGGVFERRIRCAVEQGPLFDRLDGSRFTATLVAPSPWWEDAHGDNLVSLTGWQGAITFPLSFAPAFRFGERSLDVAVNVYNAGEVRSGMLIRLYAADTVIEPQILRPGTDERLTIVGALERGEAFEIATNPGGKYARRVSADGHAVNGMRYIDPRSAFIQLEPGDNPLKVTARYGAEALTAAVVFRPLYRSA